MLFYRKTLGTWTAYTPNFVNCLVADGKAFMCKSDGPEINGNNWLHQRVAHKMAGTVTPIFIEAWRLHMAGGGVHCGTNVRRSPIGGTDWWEAWSE